MNAVAAQNVEAAPTRRQIAVAKIRPALFQVEGRAGVNAAHLADRAFGDQSTYSRMLIVELVHQRFHEQHIGRLAGFDDFAGLRGGQRRGLFTEHVLAGLCGLDRPSGMLVIGQWQIDRIHLRISKQCVVVVGGAVETETLGKLGGHAASARQAVTPAVVRSQHGGDRMLAGDFGGAEYAPVDTALGHAFLLLLRIVLRVGLTPRNRIYFLFLLFTNFLFYTLVERGYSRGSMTGKSRPLTYETQLSSRKNQLGNRCSAGRDQQWRSADAALMDYRQSHCHPRQRRQQPA